MRDVRDVGRRVSSRAAAVCGLARAAPAPGTPTGTSLIPRPPDCGGGDEIYSTSN